jgi:hypothetical protein
MFAAFPSVRRLVCGEIVEPIIRQVDVDSSRVLFKNCADEEEKLELEVVRPDILWVLEEQRLNSGCSVGVLHMECRVKGLPLDTS